VTTLKQWLAMLGAELDRREADAVDAMAPAIEQAVAQLGELLDGLPDEEDAIARELAWRRVQPQVEEIYGELNSQMERVIGAAMVEAQSPLRDLAAQWRRKSTTAPFRSRAELLAQVKIEGTPLSQWFARSSPSRWMKGLIDGVSRQVQAGWLRDQKAKAATAEIVTAAAAAMRRSVEGLVRTALWSQADLEQGATWGAGQGADDQLWQWVCRIDERTCGICLPLNGKQTTYRSGLGECPRHWGCRCSVVRID
jgi:hypothetical protein